MESSIITKFVLGDHRGISLLSSLGAITTRERYGTIIPEARLEAYILQHFSEAVLSKEMNTLSNQFLVVYSNDEPAGYAWIRSDGQRPDAFAGKKIARITEFGILKEFDNAEVRNDLVRKCLSACGMQQIIWIGEGAWTPSIWSEINN